MKRRLSTRARDSSDRIGALMGSARASLAIVAASVAIANAQAIYRTFDQDAVGAPPSEFTLGMARQQTVGQWLVRAEGSNHYLAHLTDSAASGGLSLAILTAPHPVEMRASVRLKLTDGERVGGLVWRYEDAENFYLVALDLRQQEIALYRIVRGNRIRLDDEDDLELDDSAWHTVRVVHDENQIRVSLGGIGVLRTRARDRGFAGPARAGVWSGGASTAWFDDLRVDDHRDFRR